MFINDVIEWKSCFRTSELKLIKKFASSNDFHKHLFNNIIFKTLQAHQDSSELTPKEKQKEPALTCFRFPYCQTKGFYLFKSCIRKIKANCRTDWLIVFKILYNVSKIELFCNIKDRTPKINQPFPVYITNNCANV